MRATKSCRGELKPILNPVASPYRRRRPVGSLRPMWNPILNRSRKRRPHRSSLSTLGSGQFLRNITTDEYYYYYYHSGFRAVRQGVCLDIIRQNVASCIVCETSKFNIEIVRGVRERKQIENKLFCPLIIYYFVLFLFSAKISRLIHVYFVIIIMLFFIAN